MKKTGCGIAIAAVVVVIGCTEIGAPANTDQTERFGSTNEERPTRPTKGIICGRVPCKLLLEDYSSLTKTDKEDYRECYKQCKAKDTSFDSIEREGTEKADSKNPTMAAESQNR